MKKIQILANSSVETSLIDEVTSAFIDEGFSVVDDKPDLIVTVGGDGTYLYHMKKLEFTEVPVIGVNAGSLGYFQELTLKELPAFVKDLKAGKYKISHRSLIEILDDKQEVKGVALNEIYISRDSPRSLKARLVIGKGNFAQFVGDGLIFSTTQGSTAYAAAAGGPVIAEELPVYGIVPSNAHDTTMYESLRAPVVVSDHTITSILIKDSSERPVKVEADGEKVEIDPTNKMTIRVSEKKVFVLRTQRFDYFERLAYKMIHRKMP